MLSVANVAQNDDKGYFWIAALLLVARNDEIWLYETVLRWSDCCVIAANVFNS